MKHYRACPDAAAQIRGGEGNACISGQVRFYQECGSVLVVAELSGLPQNGESGFFAWHIHEGECCAGRGFSETGGHYNPDDAPHPMHGGDLPPLLLCRGGAFVAVRTDRFCVSDVIGKTVVIHSCPDDFYSQPAGNAGTKIACGVIKKKKAQGRSCP